MTIGHVDAFQIGADDWEQYTERLEQYFVANGINDAGKKLAVFLTVIGSKAYSLLSDLLAPVKPATKTYDELVEVLKLHLRPKPVVIAERFRFHQRKQGEDEGVAPYMAALRRLADKCGFRDYLDEALRDRLVCGLRREAIQRKLLTVDGLTLKRAFDTAYGMEAAEKQASELQASIRPVAVQLVVNSKRTTSHPCKTTGHPCSRCGKPGHSPDNCFYRKEKCRVCGATGHISTVCKKRRSTPRGTNLVEQQAGLEDSEEGMEELPLMHIRMVKPTMSPAGIMLDLSIEGRILSMELDTGASMSIVSEKIWKEILKSPTLSPSRIRLKTYTGQRLVVLGQRSVSVGYGDQEQRLPLLVVAGDGPSLFGRNWLEKLQVDWGNIRKVVTPLEELLHDYEEVFRPELGTLKGIQAHLEVKPDAVPKFHRPRSVPYAIRDAIEQDLDRLEKMGVLEKVKYSDWAAPIVPVPKADGGIRICGDYKVTVNPQLKVDQFPLPTAEDLFATLAGGSSFTKLDLSQAYQQVTLDPESCRYVTINTHKGLYQYTRLPFGVASAPAIFQGIMEKLLQGISGVVVYIDDILITGKDEGEHLVRLREVLKRLKQYGLRLKQVKCKFMATSVDYLGYKIDKNGLHAMPEKIAAMVEAPEPCNVQELRAFLGLVNYYGKFISQLSTLVHPLNQLLGKYTKWSWSSACRTAFRQLKARLASSEVLAHYDMTLPLRSDCDASSYGVGAVLSHTFPDGSERPIAYASRTLSAAEKNYAQIEKEGLALIFGIKKFHKYLYGRKFTMVTDHKPLMAILGSKRAVPALAAARLQRWAILLLGYQYNLEFRTSKQHANADGFSRLPRVAAVTERDGVDAGSAAFNLHRLEALPVSAKGLREATRHDPYLSRAIRYTQDGWPAGVAAELKPYCTRKDELSVEAGCLFWGTRVVVR